MASIAMNTSQHIQVAVRCRPINDREKKQNSFSVIDCNEKRKELTVSDRTVGLSNAKTFTFDRVFGQSSKQIEVYNHVVRPVVLEVIEGYNCTIFAYGQTGTGKTFTMEGERSSNSSELLYDEDPFIGIIPRSVSQLFTVLNSLNCCEYSVKISFMELYNEELSDLLSDSNETEKLRIFDDPNRKGSVVIPGLEEIVVQNKSEVYKILQKGAEKRQKASTLMNSQSSRSHSIFTITVFIKEKSIDGEETIKVGKLNLVDLAGSENIERSGATGKRAAEAGKINKSLTTLGRIITALVEHRDHIPYRESNLTRILQDSLGGKTKTSIIATISPAQCNIEETLSTLDYAYKAKSIKNKPEVNQKLVKKALIKEYTEEIERLKRELYSTREKNGVYLPADLHQNMENRIEMQKEEIRELLNRINFLQDEEEKLKEQFKETSDQLQDRTAQLIETRKVLKETSTKLEVTEQELDENKYLLKEQVTTETNLFGQADDLLTISKTTINDCSLLLDKIERQLKVEKNNQYQTAQYSNKMKVRNDELTKSNKQYHLENSERVGGLEINLDKVNKRLIENRDENTCSLSIFNDQQENWTHEQSKLLNDGCLSKCLDYKENMFKLNESSLSTQFDIIQRFQEKLAEKFGENSKLSVQLEEFLGEHESALKANQSTLVDGAKSCEKNLAKRLKSSSRDQTEEINEIKDEISSINNSLKELKARKLSFREKLMNDIKSMSEIMTMKINSMYESLNEETKYIDDEIDQTEAKLNNQVSKLHSLEKMIKDDSREIIEDTNIDIDENIVNLSLKSFEQACLKLNQLNKTSKELKENLIENNANCEYSVNFLKTSLDEGSVAFRETLTTQINELEDKIQKLNESLKSNRIEKSNYLTNFIDQCVNGETNAISSVIEESIKLNGETKVSLNDFNIQISEFIIENQKILDKYTNEELKIDSPTGSTPVKRKFTLPSDLYRTQPHPVLIEQYRETKNLQKSSKSSEFKAGNLRRSTSLESISSVKKTSIDSLPEINKENAVVVIESKTKQIVKPNVMKKTLTVRNS